jgi:hypothetical protein
MRPPKEVFEHYEGVYKRGLAVGLPHIETDEITFRFKDELFTFPSIDCMHVAHHNGYFYEAKISELRKLAKLKH